MMTFPQRLVAVSLVCLLGCQGGDASAPGRNNPGQPAGTAVPLSRFSTDSFAFAQYSGVIAARQGVIRDAMAWRELWQEIHATVSPVPDLPEVDFNQDMVLVAALGTRPSGGYDVLLAKASEDAAGLTVEVVEKGPGAGCLTTQALTQPVDIAKVPRQDVVHFLTTAKKVSCSP